MTVCIFIMFKNVTLSEIQIDGNLSMQYLLPLLVVNEAIKMTFPNKTIDDTITKHGGRDKERSEEGPYGFNTDHTKQNIDDTIAKHGGRDDERSEEEL